MPLTTLPEKSLRTSRLHLPRTGRPLSHAHHTSQGAAAAHGAREARFPVAARDALARYTDAEGRLREVLVRPGHAGSLLVLDRDATTLGDRRLVAHLAADEPAENAGLVCRHYLRDSHGRRCRPVTPEDLLAAGLPEESREDAEPSLAPPPRAAELRDRQGCVHRLEPFDAGMSIPELRWCRCPGESELEVRRGSPAPPERTLRAAGCETVGGVGIQSKGPGPDSVPRAVCPPSRPEGVRDAVACLEGYEPIRTLTVRALARHREDPAVSVAVLGAELRRLDGSRIVLNRGLRRAVLHAMRTQGLSLSEIAFRCGRVKRDGRGNTSGETSWLSRRIGIAPESGGCEPTPWIHSEVLALIARDGLGVSPREVEL